jgi:iron(III) transport system permease protein
MTARLPLAAWGRRWALLGLFACAALPWYALQQSVWSLQWLTHLYDPLQSEASPAVMHAALFSKPWLWPLVFICGLALLASVLPALAQRRRHLGLLYMVLGFGGLLWLALQGLGIGAKGLQTGLAEPIYKLVLTPWLPSQAKQLGIGLGGSVLAIAFVLLASLGLAARGKFRGDAFVAASVLGVSLLVLTFTFWPLLVMLMSGLQDSNGVLSLGDFFRRVFNERLWGLACLRGGSRCGAAWNTLVLGLLCAFLLYGLGLGICTDRNENSIARKKANPSLDCFTDHHPPFRDWSRSNFVAWARGSGESVLRMGF